MNTSEHQWRVYLNTQEMIKMADNKVNVILALSGALTALLLTQAVDAALSGLVFYYVSVAFFGSLIICLVFSLRALLARAPSRTGLTIPRLIYFGHITERANPSDYEASVQNATEQDWARDLAYQNYEVAVIAGIKFKNYRLAWWGVLGQFVSFALFMALLIR